MEEISPEGVPAIINSRNFDIPSVPAAALKLLELSNDERTTADDLAHVIETDPALATRLLRLVNSAAYGLPHRITSIHHAVVIQGFDNTRELALHLLIFDNFIKAKDNQSFDFLFFWQHSLFVAFLSRFIGMQLRHPNPEHLYTAGLLHDLGKVVLETSGQISYSEFLDAHHGTSAEAPDAEKGFFGIDHGRLGAWCGRQWNLPQLVTLVQEHHHSGRSLYEQDPDTLRDIAIITFADFVAWMEGMGSVRHTLVPIVKAELFEYLDIGKLDLPRLLRDTDSEMQRITDFYGLHFPTPIQMRSNLLNSTIEIIGRRPLEARGEGAYHPVSLTAPHQSLDPASFIPKTLAALHDELHVKRTLMWRILPERRGLALIATHSGSDAGTLPKEIPAKLFSASLLDALRNRYPVLLTPNDSKALLEYLACPEAIAVPIRNHGRLYGLLWLDNGQSNDKINPGLVGEISEIAHELDIAITNSTIYNKEKRRAELDGLTGIYNRNALNTWLKSAFQKHKTGNPMMTLGLVDVDKFKRFNDTFGHQAGDDVLRIVAQALNSLIRPGDILGRFGGDEFLFVLIGTNAEGGLKYAKRAKHEVKLRGQLLAKRFKGQAISVSIGTATTGQGIDSLTELIAAADRALYREKDGR